MDKVTKLAELMSETIYTWCDEELISLFLDDSITWEHGNESFCSRKEKLSHLNKLGI